MHSAIRELPAAVLVEVFWRPLSLDAAVAASAVDHEGARHFLTAIGAAEGVEFSFDRNGKVTAKSEGFAEQAS